MAVKEPRTPKSPKSPPPSPPRPKSERYRLVTSALRMRRDLPPTLARCRVFSNRIHVRIEKIQKSSKFGAKRQSQHHTSQKVPIIERPSKMKKSPKAPIGPMIYRSCIPYTTATCSLHQLAVGTGQRACTTPLAFNGVAVFHRCAYDTC